MALSINYSGRNVDVTDSIQEYTTAKLASLPHIDLATSVSVEVGQHVAHKGVSKDFYVRVLIVLPRAVVRVKKEGDDVYKIVDTMLSSLRAKLTKYKDHFRKWEGEESWPEIKIEENARYKHDPEVSAMYAGYEPPVRRKKLVIDHPMSVSEAVERMELLDKKYFIFRDISTSKLAVLARAEEDYELVVIE